MPVSARPNLMPCVKMVPLLLVGTYMVMTPSFGTAPGRRDERPLLYSDLNLTITPGQSVANWKVWRLLTYSYSACIEAS
jgi:hypothetical protein